MLKKKFHVNPKDGTLGECKAQNDNCPYGGADVHFDSIKKAQEYADKQNSRLVKLEKILEQIKILSIEDTIKVANAISDYSRVGYKMWHIKNFKNMFFNDITDNEFDILMNSKYDDSIYNIHSMEKRDLDDIVSDFIDNTDVVAELQFIYFLPELGRNVTTEEYYNNIRDYLFDNIKELPDLHEFAIEAGIDDSEYFDEFVTPYGIINNCEHPDAKKFYLNLKKGEGEFLINRMGSWNTVVADDKELEDWSKNYKKEYGEKIAKTIVYDDNFKNSLIESIFK